MQTKTNPITLATLSQATEQEVFDQCARHLLTQGKQSLGTYGNCVYLASDGSKCAAGCFISDSEYKKSFEQISWHCLAYHKDVPSDHKILIERLQNIHDNISAINWKKELIELAQMLNLSDSVVQSHK